MNEYDDYTVELVEDAQKQYQEWVAKRIAELPYDPANPFWAESNMQAPTMLINAMALLRMVTHPGEEEDERVKTS